VSDEHVATKRRRHRSRWEADQVAVAYEASGISREEFCRRNDIPLKTLCRYVTRHRKQSASGSDPQRWISVEVAPHNSQGIELAVLLSTGRRIEVKRGFDAGTLRRIVAVLESV